MVPDEAKTQAMGSCAAHDATLYAAWDAPGA